MTKSKYLYLKECESILFQYLDFYIYEFSTQIHINVVYRSDLLSWIEVELFNEKSNRIIQVIISEGINANNQQSFGIRTNICKTENNGEKIAVFGVKDYSRKVNSDIEFNEYYLSTHDQFLVLLVNYLKNLTKFLKLSELEGILFSNGWIQIIPDYSPYK
jgi:hypothetical protein